MSNNRKVQADIDRLLKKTTEGIEAYEELYSKFDSASNPSTKERLEGDLKKEIKKLQRQREQIKGYIASSEVKDTRQLETYRKKIETKMEAFKQCEREMKTKAFSKEGLASAANEWNDSPLAQTESWLKNCIEEARKKIEILEYEAHKSANVVKLGRRAKQASGKSDTQARLEQLQLHFYKWEALLRMVINEEVGTMEVDDVRKDIDKILDDDTELSALSNMKMYQEFDIPDPKPKAPAVEDPLPEAEKPTPTASSQSAKQTAAAKKTPPMPTPAKSANPSPTVTTQEKEKPAPPPQQQAVAPQAQALEKTSNNASQEDMAPEWVDDDELDAANDDTFGDDAMGDAFNNKGGGSLAEMAQATSKLAGTTNVWESRKLELRKTKPATGAGALPSGGAGTLDDELDAANDDTFGDDAMGDAFNNKGGGSLAEMAQATNKLASATNDWESRKLELRKTPSSSSVPISSSPAAKAVVAPPAAPQQATPQQVQPQPASIPQQLQQQHPVAAAPTMAATAAAAAPVSKQPPADPAPGCKYRASTMLNMLDMSLGNMPQTLDVERNRTYEPPNAIQPLPCFPQEVHPILSCRDIYRKFDLETLFFIFYYHQKSYQQYFASKELKAHSFRYHTDLKRWYQRREKPKESTTNSERGSYLYFDYENTWQNQTEEDFTFEYKFLEDDLK